MTKSSAFTKIAQEKGEMLSLRLHLSLVAFRPLHWISNYKKNWLL